MELFHLQGTDLKHSIAYQPQTDGQSEVVNRGLQTYLRCLATTTPKQWANWLAWVEFWYNTSYHTSLKCTPFQALYGRPPPFLVRYELGSAANVEVEKSLLKRDAMLDVLKQQLLRSQQRMKADVDAHRRDLQFSVVDMVCLKLQHRCKSLPCRPFEKLAPRYFRPYKIVARIGEVAYKLQLPPEAIIHPVFHVSQLKRAIGSTKASPTFPTPLTEDLEMLVEPARRLC